MKSRCILPALGLASVLCVSATAVANEPPTLTAGGEVLEGEWLQPGEAVFRGIPYAAAPVGDLRWRPPAPHRARVGRQLARDFGATCPQTEFLHGWERAIAVAFGNGDKFVATPLRTSEDCLYLSSVARGRSTWDPSSTDGSCRTSPAGSSRPGSRIECRS